MARHNRYAPPSPAAALRAAIDALTRQMQAAPPDKAGALAVKIAALAAQLHEMQRKSPQEEAKASALRMRALDEEVGRLIELRAHERLEALLEERGLAPPEPLPPSAYVSFMDGFEERG